MVHSAVLCPNKSSDVIVKHQHCTLKCFYLLVLRSVANCIFEVVFAKLFQKKFHQITMPGLSLQVTRLKVMLHKVRGLFPPPQVIPRAYHVFKRKKLAFLLTLLMPTPFQAIKVGEYCERIVESHDKTSCPHPYWVHRHTVSFTKLYKVT